MSSRPVCPFCRYPIKEGSRIHRCTRCNVLHHSECWRENKGCTTYGCGSRPAAANQDPLPVVCPSCGENNRERDRTCWACSAVLPRPTEEAEQTSDFQPEALPDEELTEGETGLRQEAYEALLAVQSALSVGVNVEKYSGELLKAKQACDRLEARSSHRGLLFWTMVEELILEHQHAIAIWRLTFQRAPYTNDLMMHVDVASEIGQSMIRRYPSLIDRVQKRNVWSGPLQDRLAIDDILQAMWSEARQNLEQLRACMRK